MRKEILREVRKQFCQRLMTRVPEFRAQSGVVPGMDLYKWEMTPKKSVFIALIPNSKPYHDSFMIEIAWSSGEFPETASLQHQNRISTGVSGRLRLPQLWRENWRGAIEPWWEAGESLTLQNSDRYHSDEETQRRIAMVPSIVDDAVSKIVRYAIPFFKQATAGYPQ